MNAAPGRARPPVQEDMPHGIRFSIRKQVAVLLVFMIIFPVALIATLSYNLSKSVIQNKTTLYNVDILTEVSNNIRNHLKEIDNLTVYICCNESVQERVNGINHSTNAASLVALRQQLAKQLINMTVANSSIMEYTLLTNSGTRIGSSLLSFEGILPYSQEDMDLLSANKGSLVWIAKGGEAPRILMGRQINDLGTQKPIGYLIARYDDTVLTGILGELEYFADGIIHIIDAQNAIISTNDHLQLGQKFPYAGVMEATKGSVYVPESGQYISYCPIPGTSWRLVSAIPAVYYEHEIIELRNYTMLIAIAAALVNIVLAWWLARQLTDPILNLCRIMGVVGEGNFDVRKPIPYKNEIGMLYSYFFQMVDQVEKLVTETNEQQLLIQKAELNSLRMQINPHFIYNALESIKWTAHLQKNEEIVVIVKALGDFMRNSISGAEFITLEGELTNVNNYLTIQKFRYGKRLNVDFSMDDSLLAMKIPKFILQPLIENAIVHGLEQKVGAGRIAIRTSQTDNVVSIEVSDNGIGFTDEVLMTLNLDSEDEFVASNGNGIGLRNVHQRIRMYYGKPYGLRIESRYGIETKVTVTLPAVNL